MDSAFLHGVKKIFHATEDIKELIDPYVNFSFAGQQVSSKIVYTCSHPEFNQELRLGLKVIIFIEKSFDFFCCLIQFSFHQCVIKFN